MSFVDKFLNAVRLNADDEEYLDDEYYDEEDEDYYEEEEKPAGRSLFGRRSSNTREKSESSAGRFTQADDPAPSYAANSNITPMRQRRGGNAVMEVCVIKPKSFEDSRETTMSLLEGRTIVLNLEGLDFETGQRIIDFTSGACMAINGSLKKVSAYIFIAAPEEVDLSGDLQAFADAFDISSLRR